MKTLDILNSLNSNGFLLLQGSEFSYNHTLGTLAEGEYRLRFLVVGRPAFTDIEVRLKANGKQIHSEIIKGASWQKMKGFYRHDAGFALAEEALVFYMLKPLKVASLLEMLPPLSAQIKQQSDPFQADILEISQRLRELPTGLEGIEAKNNEQFWLEQMARTILDKQIPAQEPQLFINSARQKLIAGELISLAEAEHWLNNSIRNVLLAYHGKNPFKKVLSWIGRIMIRFAFTLVRCVPPVYRFLIRWYWKNHNFEILFKHYKEQ